jgi:hypothetical protein
VLPSPASLEKPTLVAMPWKPCTWFNNIPYPPRVPEYPRLLRPNVPTADFSEEFTRARTTKWK